MNFLKEYRQQLANDVNGHIHDWIRHVPQPTMIGTHEHLHLHGGGAKSNYEKPLGYNTAWGHPSTLAVSGGLRYVSDSDHESEGESDEEEIIGGGFWKDFGRGFKKGFTGTMKVLGAPVVGAVTAMETGDPMQAVGAFETANKVLSGKGISGGKVNLKGSVDRIRKLLKKEELEGILDKHAKEVELDSIKNAVKLSKDKEKKELMKKVREAKKAEEKAKKAEEKAKKAEEKAKKAESKVKKEVVEKVKKVKKESEKKVKKAKEEIKELKEEVKEVKEEMKEEMKEVKEVVKEKKPIIRKFRKVKEIHLPVPEDIKEDVEDVDNQIKKVEDDLKKTERKLEQTDRKKDEDKYTELFLKKERLKGEIARRKEARKTILERHHEFTENESMGAEDVKGGGVPIMQQEFTGNDVAHFIGAKESSDPLMNQKVSGKQILDVGKRIGHIFGKGMPTGNKPRNIPVSSVSYVEKLKGGGKPNKRAEIVKKIMKERGVSMIQASRIVKQEKLY